MLASYGDKTLAQLFAFAFSRKRHFEWSILKSKMLTYLLFCFNPCCLCEFAKPSFSHLNYISCLHFSPEWNWDHIRQHGLNQVVYFQIWKNNNMIQTQKTIFKFLWKTTWFKSSSLILNFLKKWVQKENMMWAWSR